MGSRISPIVLRTLEAAPIIGSRGVTELSHCRNLFGPHCEYNEIDENQFSSGDESFASPRSFIC
jgi:hypothetical protein